MSEDSVTPPDDGTDRDRQLEAVIADYIRACETGTAPDRHQILERHPELANDLREFFANRDQMDRLAFPASVPSYDKSTFIRSEVGQVGLCIGAYTLVQKLGEGGMGEVWVAKQSEPVKRKVALKLIKRGMNSKDVLARFEQERQALAMMDHPSIAKVFDGGVTPDGQPYFVMELVNGLSLTKYCDEARLTPRERMELFVPICQAVQHAHQKGIVHRDLKPSNILVTMYDGRPVPKVIDFGVAKATGGRLTDESMSTQVGAVVGTLEYMSPEQAGYSGQDIDTRADIYSLGVILYELLTGLRPIDGQRLRKAGLAEMIRIIQQEEPSKPSTRLSLDAALPSLAALRQTEPKRLTALLRGELDWVVMKCLEKSRDRRYETANGLARDIQHYLADEPVEARPASASYRFRKFLRRHKGPVLAAALVLLALIGGIIGTTWGLVRESQQRVIAETNEDKANDAAKQERIAKEKANEAAEQARIAKEDAIAAEIEERKQRERADENFQLSRRQLYAAHMNSAQELWDDKRVDETLLLLDMYQPAIEIEGGPNDLRGFEWYYWNHMAYSYELNLKAGMEEASCVAFSPDGKRLASGGLTGVKLWDAWSGRETLTLTGHTERVETLAFSPDGARLASGSRDRKVKVFDAISGQETLTLKGHTDNVESVTFSPDGKRLASASRDQTVKVWDATSGQEMLTLTGHTSVVNSVVFSADGKTLTSAGGDGVKFWDGTNGHEDLTHTLESDPIIGLSPDGTRLASTSTGHYGKGIVNLWDAMSGQKTRTFYGHTTKVNCLAFSPDGTRLGLAGGSFERPGNLTVWDELGREILTLTGHRSYVNCVSFSPDGTRLASGSQDGTVKVWNSSSSQNPFIIGDRRKSRRIRVHPSRSFFDPSCFFYSVAFSPDGKRLASVSEEFEEFKVSGTNSPKRDLKSSEVSVWDATSGQEILTLTGHTGRFSSVTFSPDGTRLASAGSDGTVKVWDAISGQEILTLIGPPGSSGNVAFSPDGRRLASAFSGWGAKVWDATSGQEIVTLIGSAGSFSNVAFSPDGTRLASASDGAVKVWNAASGQETLTIRIDFRPEIVAGFRRIWDVAFSPDGRRLAALVDGEVKVWNAASGQETLTIRIDFRPEIFEGISRITNVTFSPDGKQLALSSGAPMTSTTSIHDATTGLETLKLVGNSWGTSGVKFSPDGKRLASGGQGRIVIWDARPWTPELRAEQQALSVIRVLEARSLAKPALRDAIAADATISEPVRQRALELVSDWPE